MRLTKIDKELLMSWGFSKADIIQIERASCKTTYTEHTVKDDKAVRSAVPMKRAIEVLGRESFLSGLSRSAFHRSAMRGSADGNTRIYFDSSKFFKTDC